MKIIFIGCVWYSNELLNCLLERGYNVVGIISKDDTGFNADYYDITQTAKTHGIPYKKTKNVNVDEIINWVKSLEPDVVYCFGWNSLIKQNFLEIPRIGVVGYHPTALPKNRGRHPIIWALILGLKETASTFFLMGEGADDGNIVSQTFLTITKDDTSHSVYKKLIEHSKLQVLEFSEKLKRNELITLPQEHHLANLWRKRSKLDGKIDFRMSAESIYNLTRGLTKPYPGAHVEFGGDEFKVWKTSIANTTKINYEPGKVLDIQGEKILVKCGLDEQAILLEEHSILKIPEVGDYIL